jgi:23S rRNA (cytidine1920-2'-O)/16S rRNA (cytidine1409-2'-O)-methyltransferase
VPLVKPQFEAGRGAAKGGVVRDQAVHRSVLASVVKAAEAVGLGAQGVVASPILGPEGNREFLLDLRRGDGSEPDLARRLDEVVAAPGAPRSAAPGAASSPGPAR